MTRNGTRALVLLPILVVGATTCIDDAPPEAPSQFITVKRAWLPGERAALIARVVADQSLAFQYVGNLSDLAPFLFDPDSVVEVVPNPAYVASDVGSPVAPALRGARAPQFAAGWTIIGLDVHIEFTADQLTLDWLGQFWFNPGEETWKGLILIATNRSTAGRTSLSTAAFDASGGKSGAGGGESRQSTATYWEASSGSGRITASGFSGATTTITSGPFTGGTVRNGSMQGRDSMVGMPRAFGTDTPATKIVDINFLGTGGSSPIAAMQLTCVFPTPCTGQAALVARAWIEARRRGVPVERLLKQPPAR